MPLMPAEFVAIAGNVTRFARDRPMDFDLHALIPLIVLGSGAAVLGMSYFGAYMLGRTRGRREVELEHQARLHGDSRSIDYDRVVMVESAVASMAQAIERLTDAQRVALLERMRAGSEPAPSRLRAPRQDTPA